MEFFLEIIGRYTHSSPQIASSDVKLKKCVKSRWHIRVEKFVTRTYTWKE